MDAGVIWDTVVLSPMINVLIVISDYLLNSFGLTIIIFTVIIRGVMYPLTRRQLKASKGMQELQPKIAEIRKKFAKDKQRRAKEEMALMKQSGVSPAGCLLPMLIQMPVWIALYQSIIRVLAATPEEFLNLSRHLYDTWPQVFYLVPLESKFLWLDLAVPDTMMLMPILVGGSMWLQQKMMTPQSADPAQQAQGRMMLWMMPLMFAFFTLQFPSGLALYWVASNIISIVMQYFISGWGGLSTLFSGKKVEDTRKPPKRYAPIEYKQTGKHAGDADIVDARPSEEEGSDDETTGDQRQDRGRGYSDSYESTKRQSRRDKGRRPKRR